MKKKNNANDKCQLSQHSALHDEISKSVLEKINKKKNYK